MRHWWKLLLCGLLWGHLALAGETPSRPESWATPMASPVVKNFYRLDQHLYRSAQPDAAGFAALQRLGIVTVLNLRDNHSDDDEAAGTGLQLRRVAMEADEISYDQLVEALRIIRQSPGPVLVHCWHGSDRTGAVSAMYRVVVQGWPREAAVEELTNGGYGYHSIYGNIPALIRRADVDSLRQRVLAP